MKYTVRPISDRTGFTGKHRRSPFRSGWTETLDLLDREMFMLAGKDLVIEVDVAERDIRIDGQLYARARPASPAIRLAFESRHGPLIYATDRFDRWQDNVRAIALGLESLRRVDRYGIAEHGEQYTGYRAIEAKPAGMGSLAAAQLLERVAIGADDGPIRDREIVHIQTDRDHARLVLKMARQVAHPDIRDGDRSTWDQVEAAAKALGLEDGAR